MKGVEHKPGLIPLAIREIFSQIKQDNLIAKVSISYFEIYNENIIDLLSSYDPPKYLEIVYDKKQTFIQELKEEEVKNEDDSFYYYEQGETRRKFASNNINMNSSRSHTIFRINLEVSNPDYTISRSTISMVDLAGS